MQDSLRAALVGVLVLGLSACSGSGGSGGLFGGLGGGFTQCDPGQSVQLARPSPGATGVNPSIGSLEIVASGGTGALHDNPGQWYLSLTSNFGDNLGGYTLGPTSDTGGPHPYASDFYYATNIPTLPTGRTWTVLLNESNANCNAVPLQTFST